MEKNRERKRMLNKRRVQRRKEPREGAIVAQEEEHCDVTLGYASPQQSSKKPIAKKRPNGRKRRRAKEARQQPRKVCVNPLTPIENVFEASAPFLTSS